MAGAALRHQQATSPGIPAQRASSVATSASARAWGRKNPDKRRIHGIEYRKRHPDYGKRYYAKNRDKVLAKHARRRAYILNSDEHFTRVDVATQYRSQKGKCWHCGKLVGQKYHIDHLIPLSRGGSNSARNIVISCPSCNVTRRNKLTMEWNGRIF